MGVLISVQELVQSMRQTDGSDYGNWGVWVLPGDESEVSIGPCQDGWTLCIPLLDIVEYAAEVYPNYGFEEMYFLFGVDEWGNLEWGLCVG